MKKRGLSPVIATTLLIVLVIAIAVIVFLWFRGMVKMEATKFGKNVKLVCEDVVFTASYSGGSLQISNNGNVPIYDMNVKKEGDGSYDTISLKNDILNSNWPTIGLNQGQAFSEDISSLIDTGTNKITLIPVLLGNTGEGEETFVCDEQYGYEIIIT